MRRKTVKTEVEAKQFKWGESYTSLFLGLVIVVVVAVLVLSLGRNRQTKQTSSVQEGPMREEKVEEAKKDKDQKTYVIKKGDDLWNIAVSEYGDGYKWADIAKANNLANPDLIFSENILKIPR